MAATVDIGRELGVSVKETVESAKEYKSELADLLTQLANVETQIERTAAKSESVIRKHFSQVLKELSTALEERCNELVSQVLAVKCQAFQLLRESRQLIEAKLVNAEKVLVLGQDILSSDPVSTPQIIHLCEKASLLGSLPEVPSPSSVASISVTFEDDLSHSVCQRVQSYGCVNAYSLVQICYSEERPGALLLHWMQREDENCPSEVNLFRLQCVPGDAIEQPELSTSFREVFSGQDTSWLARDLTAGTPYSFRVSGCFSNGNNNNCKWSPWSPPFVAATTLPHYEWEPSRYYGSTHEGRIATKLVEDTSSVLLSKGSLFRVCHSLQFRLLETGITANIDEGLALLDMNRITTDRPTSLVQKGSLHINLQGAVSVDGSEMSSRLSPLQKGSTVTFDLEPLENLNRVRVTVSSGQGQVTYDWPLSDNFRFAMFFRCAGWKVVVE